MSFRIPLSAEIFKKLSLVKVKDLESTFNFLDLVVDWNVIAPTRGTLILLHGDPNLLNIHQKPFPRRSKFLQCFLSLNSIPKQFKIDWNDILDVTHRILQLEW